MNKNVKADAILLYKNISVNGIGRYEARYVVNKLIVKNRVGREGLAAYTTELLTWLVQKNLIKHITKGGNNCYKKRKLKVADPKKAVQNPLNL